MNTWWILEFVAIKQLGPHCLDLATFSLVQAIMARRPIVGGNWKCNPDSIGKLDELIKHMRLGQIGHLVVAVWILVRIAVGCLAGFHMEIKCLNIVQQVQSSHTELDVWQLTFGDTQGSSIRKHHRFQVIEIFLTPKERV